MSTSVAPLEVAYVTSRSVGAFSTNRSSATLIKLLLVVVKSGWCARSPGGRMEVSVTCSAPKRIRGLGRFSHAGVPNPSSWWVGPAPVRLHANVLVKDLSKEGPQQRLHAVLHGQDDASSHKPGIISLEFARKRGRHRPGLASVLHASTRPQLCLVANNDNTLGPLCCMMVLFVRRATRTPRPLGKSNGGDNRSDANCRTLVNDIGVKSLAPREPPRRRRCRCDNDGRTAHNALAQLLFCTLLATPGSLQRFLSIDSPLWKSARLTSARLCARGPGTIHPTIHMGHPRPFPIDRGWNGLVVSGEALVRHNVDLPCPGTVASRWGTTHAEKRHGLGFCDAVSSRSQMRTDRLLLCVQELVTRRGCARRQQDPPNRRGLKDLVNFGSNGACLAHPWGGRHQLHVTRVRNEPLAHISDCVPLERVQLAVARKSAWQARRPRCRFRHHPLPPVQRSFKGGERPPCGINSILSDTCDYPSGERNR